MTQEDAGIVTKNPAGHKNVLGPELVFLTPLSSAPDYAVAHSIFPSGAFVPVHSHADRETFYIISGELESWNGEEWTVLRPSDTVDIPGHREHAFRNRSGQDATMILITTNHMGHFFEETMREAAANPAGPPTPEMLGRLAAVSARYGYSMGSPADNARAGFELP